MHFVALAHVMVVCFWRRATRCSAHSWMVLMSMSNLMLLMSSPMSLNSLTTSCQALYSASISGLYAS